MSVIIFYYYLWCWCRILCFYNSFEECLFSGILKTNKEGQASLLFFSLLCGHNFTVKNKNQFKAGIEELRIVNPGRNLIAQTSNALAYNPGGVGIISLTGDHENVWQLLGLTQNNLAFAAVCVSFIYILFIEASFYFQKKIGKKMNNLLRFNVKEVEFSICALAKDKFFLKYTGMSDDFYVIQLTSKRGDCKFKSKPDVYFEVPDKYHKFIKSVISKRTGKIIMKRKKLETDVELMCHEDTGLPYYKLERGSFSDVNLSPGTIAKYVVFF